MTKLYSNDTKLVVIRMVLQGITFPEIERTIGMELSFTSVQRWFGLYQTTLAVIANPEENMSRSPITLLERHVQEFVLHSLQTDPTLHLNELHSKINKTYRVRVPLETLSTILQNRLTLTSKESKTAQTDHSLAINMEEIVKIDPRCLVFTDRTMISNSSQELSLSVLPAISLDGIVQVDIHTGGYSRLTFESYLERGLLPAMNRWPCRNSVLVLNNSPIYQGGKVEDLCAAQGVWILYLPSSSWVGNPVEKGFIELNQQLKNDSLFQNTSDLATGNPSIFLTCVELFSSDLGETLFQRSGYM